MNLMLKSCLKSIFLFFIFLFVLSCSISSGPEPDQISADAELNSQIAKVMKVYSKAVNSNDPALVNEFQQVLQDFDAQYQSSLADEFEKSAAINRFSDSTNWDPLADLPINTDGAVYLSGGGDGAVSTVIKFVSPKSTAGQYYHGAALDLDKFDPTNLDAQCFETAIIKGAGYETPNQWMRKPNVAVFKPKTSQNPQMLNLAQTHLDYYCSDANTNMQYGFFKDYIDLSSVVTKEDNYYWYCTKVIWRIYKELGIDIDSNSVSLNAWKNSGLYSLVNTYYHVVYFYNSTLANKKINEYMAKTTSTIVHAEEIYYSPELIKIYEKIRAN
jgi:hypothetical protein